MGVNNTLVGCLTVTLSRKLAFLHEITTRFCMRSGKDMVKELKAHNQSLGKYCHQV